MSSTDSDFEDTLTSLNASHSGSTEVATDESEDESLNLSVTTISEFRKEYSGLIDAVEEFSMEDRINDSEHRKELEKNMKRSKAVFETFESVNELYMACLHTKKVTELIRTMSEHICNSHHSRFTVDKFILGVKQSFNDGVNSREYSIDAGIENLLQVQNTNCSKTAPAFVGIMGLFSRESLSSAPIPVTPVKVKAPRAPIKKKVFDQTNATQHTEVNLTKEQRTGKDTSAVKISMDVLQKLQASNRQNNEPIGLYDFTMDKSSLGKTIENIFHVAFLIRDGRVSVKREADANLVLKPETPPENVDQMGREQYILSISSSRWKALAMASQGDNWIASCPVGHSEPGNATPGTSKLLSESENSSPESPEQMRKRKKFKK